MGLRIHLCIFLVTWEFLIESEHFRLHRADKMSAFHVSGSAQGAPSPPCPVALAWQRPRCPGGGGRAPPVGSGLPLQSRGARLRKPAGVDDDNVAAIGDRGGDGASTPAQLGPWFSSPVGESCTPRPPEALLIRS